MHTNQATHDSLGIFALIAGALAPGSSARGATRAGAVPPAASGAGRVTGRRPFWERVDHWFWMRRQAALEAYLADAADLCDLEARLRNLERAIPYRCL